MKNIAVVSLKSEYKRRQHIEALFSDNKLDFEFFDAIDKSKVAGILNNYKIIINSKNISLGEVACYLSHYCLWQQVVEKDLPYLMIFEDDIYFSQSAKALLNQLNWLPNSFDIIKLETMYQRVLINKGINLPMKHRLSKMKSRHMGAAGYIISREGAEKLIAMTQQFGIDLPVDQVMFNKLIKQMQIEVFQVFPALCIQDKIYNEESIRFESELEETRAELKDMNLKPSRYQKLTRELGKIYQQLKPKNIYHVIWLLTNGYKKQKIEYNK